MITIYYKEENHDDLHIIPKPIAGCWIHVNEATSEDIQQISELIDLDYSDLADCLDKYEIPRIERILEHVLIFTRHPTHQEAGLYTTTLTIILTRDYIITVCPTKSLLIENFISNKFRISTALKSKLLIYILLAITQEFTMHIKRIRAHVLKQEKKMKQVDSEDITGLTINEENLHQYLSSLVPLRSVLEAITSGKYTILYEKDQDLLEDLLNTSIQSEDLCIINLRSIRSLRDSYQIIFTNELNRTIKLLTALTIILSLPTMVASLYGMNVALPFAEHPHAFFMILLFIVLISYVGLIIFQRKKWL